MRTFLFIFLNGLLIFEHSDCLLKLQTDTSKNFNYYYLICLSANVLFAFSTYPSYD